MQVFSFSPKSDEEIIAIQNKELLQEGIYSFIVRQAIPGFSKANNSMITVLLAIMDTAGSVRNIKDFLVSTDEMIFKLKHFCESIGCEEDYKNGYLNLQGLIGRSGQLMLGIQKGKIKPDGITFYPDKNSVKDYIKVEVQKTLANDAALNEDVPF